MPRSAASPWNSGEQRGRSFPHRRLRGLLPARHAGRLCARARRDLRRALDRSAARGGDAQSLRRHRRFRASRHPLLHPRRRDHGRRRHGRAARQSRKNFRRLDPRRAGAGQHPRLDVLRLHLRIVGRRYRLDRLGDDPADDQERLSAALRRQRDSCGLAAAAADPTVAQRRHLFARRRRLHLDRRPFSRRRDTRASCSGSR